jgi:hypothetical protein
LITAIQSLIFSINKLVLFRHPLVVVFIFLQFNFVSGIIAVFKRSHLAQKGLGMAKVGNVFTYLGQDYAYVRDQAGTMKATNVKGKAGQEVIVPTSYTVWQTLCPEAGCGAPFEVFLPWSFPVGRFNMVRRCPDHRKPRVKVAGSDEYIPEEVKERRKLVRAPRAGVDRGASKRHAPADDYVFACMVASNEAAGEGVRPGALVQMVRDGGRALPEETRKVLGLHKPEDMHLKYLSLALARLREKGRIVPVGGGNARRWLLKTSNYIPLDQQEPKPVRPVVSVQPAPPVPAPPVPASPPAPPIAPAVKTQRELTIDLWVLRGVPAKEAEEAYFNPDARKRLADELGPYFLTDAALNERGKFVPTEAPLEIRQALGLAPIVRYVADPKLAEMQSQFGAPPPPPPAPSAPPKPQG